MAGDSSLDQILELRMTKNLLFCPAHFARPRVARLHQRSSAHRMDFEIAN